MTQWTPAAIVTLLSGNNRAVEKGIVAVFNRQTIDEQSTVTTRHSNGIGFNVPDAKLGTYYAKWVMAGRELTGWHLSRARELAIKYRAQLADVANTNGKPCPPAYIAVKGPRRPRTNTSGDTQSECVDRCADCSDHAQGVEYSHNGTPVLFLCHKCRTR